VTSALGGFDAVLDELVRERVAESAEGDRRELGDFAVTAGCAALLEEAALAAPEGVFVEIGCASGASTLALCRGRLRGGAAGLLGHVIDPMQTSHYDGIGRRSLERAGVADRVDLREEWDHVALPALLREGVRCGVAFIDGGHRFEEVMLDLACVDRLLSTGGVMILHDVWMPAVQHAAAYWAANMACEAVTVRGGELSREAWGEAADPTWSAPGAPAAPAVFRDRLLAYCDWQTLLLRKTGESRRAWDHFEAFV